MCTITQSWTLYYYMALWFIFQFDTARVMPQICALLHRAGLCTTIWLSGLYFSLIRLELCHRYVHYYTELDSVLLYGSLVYISVGYD